MKILLSLLPSRQALVLPLGHGLKALPRSRANAFDHSMLNTPVLVRSRKLSNIGPG